MNEFIRISAVDVEHRGRRNWIPNYPKGVYKLLNEALEVVYVGKGNIRDRLYRHIVEDLKGRRSHYRFVEYAVVPDPESLETTLIKKLRPRFNYLKNEQYYRP